MRMLTVAAHEHQIDVSPLACTVAITPTATTFATANPRTSRWLERSGAPQVATM